MFYIEEILYCLWREKCQPKAGNKDQFLQFHRYSSSAIKFPTTGLAHSSKSGSRNWSWLAGAPGETNSVIVLDIFFPLPRSFGDQTLWFPERTPCENQTGKDLRPNLFLTGKFDPQGWTVPSRTIVAREKLDAPDSTKTSRRSPRSSAQISAKRVQFGLQSHFSCLLATPLDVKYTSELFIWFACIVRARVQIVHNYSQFSDGLSQEFQSPAKIHSLTSWRSNVVGGRTIVHRQAFMFSIRVALCPLCVAGLNALLYKKLKSILWQGKGWMNPQYLPNIQRQMRLYMPLFCVI